MEILEMRATFGKLQNATLHLQSGLNIFYAPNEFGKSTWAQFLRVMLYGIRGRADTSDKNLYAPWNGAPMEGQLDVSAGGNAYTIRRYTRRAGSPMGELSCTYRGTVEPAAPLSGYVPGDVLCGVPIEVFVRSTFIGQSTLAIRQDAELERRIAALISSSDEDASYSECIEWLRKQQNRRKYNRCGSIPALEARREYLNRMLQQIRNLSSQVEEADRECLRCHADLLALKAQQDLWDRHDRQESAQKLLLARQAAQSAAQNCAALARQLGRLPDNSDLRQLEGDYSSLKRSWDDVLQAQKDAEASRAATERTQRACAVHPLYGSDERSIARQIEQIIAPHPPGTTLPILSACIALIGIAVSALLSVHTYWPIACGAIVVAGSLLLCWCRKRHSAHIAQDNAQRKRRQLQDRWRDYLPLYDAWQNACRKAEQEQSLVQHLYLRYREQLNALCAAITPFSSGVRNENDIRNALDDIAAKQEQLADARRKAEETALRLRLLDEQFPDGEPPASEALPLPSLSKEDLAILLPQAATDEQNACRRHNALLGQLHALDNPDELHTQLEQIDNQIRTTQEEYDAIALAMEALNSANAELQSRFSPALGKRTAQILSRITGGRYQRVFLSRDLDLEAEAVGDTAPHALRLLSQGTADQLYLAVRLAICEMVLPQEISVPLILDDALLSFDDERLHAALDYLLELSRTRQILLFTCQHREGDYLDGQEGVSIQTLE